MTREEIDIAIKAGNISSEVIESLFMYEGKKKNCKVFGASKISGFCKKPENKWIVEAIEKATDFLNYNKEVSFCLRLINLRNGITNIDLVPKCPICGKPRRLNRFDYHSTCSTECGNILKIQNCKKTTKEKYGVDNIFQLESTKDKIKKTTLEKYGVEHNSQLDSFKDKINKTIHDRYGEEGLRSEVIRQKAKDTCMERYGVENASSTQEVRKKVKDTLKETYGANSTMEIDGVKEKIKTTNLEKYGVENSFQREDVKEKIKETNLEKYGDTCVLRTDYGKAKTKETCISKYGLVNYQSLPETKAKAKQTNIEKYGCDHYLQTSEGRKLISRKLSSEEIQNKMNATRRMNKTFTKSKAEDKLFEILQDYFLDVERQRKDPNYNFNCDFYIDDLAMYVEYQGSWTHGGKSFTSSVEDLDKLALWIEKAKDCEYYQKAIDDWTVNDVMKRKLANEKNISYLEIFKFETEEDVITQIRRCIGDFNLNKEELKEYFLEIDLYVSSPIFRREILEELCEGNPKKELSITDVDIVKHIRKRLT